MISLRAPMPSPTAPPVGDWRVAIETARLTSLVDRREGSAQLRTIGVSLPNRQARVEFARRAIEFDDDAGDWIAKAEAKVGDAAEFAYWSCLQLYPFARDVVLGYAKALHEQGKLLDAEVQLRNAIALGTPPESVRRQLQAIASARGESCVEEVVSKFAQGLKAPINALSSPRGDAFLYPDLHTIEMLYRFLSGERPGIQVVAQLQKASRTAWDLLINIVSTGEFRRANLDLMYLLNGVAQRRPCEWQVR